MELFNRILHTAVEGHASDVHLKIGTPAVFRIHRQLVAIECPLPTEEWLNKVIDHIVPRHAKKGLEENREVDFIKLRQQLAGGERWNEQLIESVLPKNKS